MRAKRDQTTNKDSNPQSPITYPRIFDLQTPRLAAIIATGGAPFSSKL
jgi:hypothetical protein